MKGVVSTERSMDIAAVEAQMWLDQLYKNWLVEFLGNRGQANGKPNRAIVRRQNNVGQSNNSPNQGAGPNPGNPAAPNAGHYNLPGGGPGQR